MIITYQGLQFFKLQLGDLTVAINPPAKDSKFKAARFGADVVLQTLNNIDFNGGGELKHGERLPFVIKGPGEYEVKGIFIKGFASESEAGINTIYSLNLDGMNICFLGALSSPTISGETIEALDDIDILFVPIGGDGVLTPADAYKLAVNLESKIIIPMHYNDATLKTFLKEAGDKGSAVDKLTLKKKDLDGKEGEIVVLAPQN